MFLVPHTLKGKLLVSAGIAIVLILGAIGINLLYQRDVVRSFSKIDQRDIPLVNNIQTMASSGLLSGTALRNRLLLKDKVDSGWHKVAAAAVGQFDKALVQAKKEAGSLPDVQALLDQISGLWAQNRVARLQMIDLLKQNQDAQAFDVLIREAQPNWHTIRQLLQRATKMVVAVQESDKQEVRLSLRNAAILNTVMLLLAVVVGGGLIGLAMMSMNRRLSHSVHLMESIAEGEGDLTSRMPDKGRDEFDALGSAFNRFVSRIQRLVLEVSSSTAQLAAAAEQLSLASEEGSAQVAKQQSETDLVATAMNEMSATVQEVARNAADAAQAAQHADKQAAEGRKVVGETIGSIESLAAEVERVAQSIHRLEDDSNNIGKVLEVINGISEQTNLLALNAAIEAARAGEQGRGFAVVADEVRTLAQRTQDSTGEIRAMIESLQSGAKESAIVMEAGQERAGASVERARAAGDALGVIAGAVTRITDMNTQIASAAEEQSAVAEEINRNVINISQSTERAAASTEQTADASQGLARLASSLQAVVGQFKVE